MLSTSNSNRNSSSNDNAAEQKNVWHLNRVIVWAPDRSRCSEVYFMLANNLNESSALHIRLCFAFRQVIIARRIGGKTNQLHLPGWHSQFSWTAWSLGIDLRVFMMMPRVNQLSRIEMLFARENLLMARITIIFWWIIHTALRNVIVGLCINQSGWINSSERLNLKFIGAIEGNGTVCSRCWI